MILRRVGYKDPDTGKHYSFLTNNFHLATKTIADIYKDRWQIELYFNVGPFLYEIFSRARENYYTNTTIIAAKPV